AQSAGRPEPADTAAAKDAVPRKGSEAKRASQPKTDKKEASQKARQDKPPTTSADGESPAVVGDEGPAKPPGDVMGVLWSKYQRIGQKAAEAGDAELAEKSLKEALAEAEQLGEKDPRVALTLDGLAQFYLRQGRYADAEQLAKRLLARREQVSGPESPDVAASLVFLASLYQLEGKPLEAEPLVKKAIGIVEKLPGNASEDLAQTMSLLASI